MAYPLVDLIDGCEAGGVLEEVLSYCLVSPAELWRARSTGSCIRRLGGDAERTDVELIRWGLVKSHSWL